MASGGRRRRPRRESRPKAKKKTKYLSLSRLIIKTEEVGTPPPPRSPEADAEAKMEEEEHGGGQHQVEPPFALHHEASTLFAALPAPSLSDILGENESPSPRPPCASPDDGGASGGGGAPGFPGGAAGEAEEEELVLARRALRGRERWVYCATTTTSSGGTSSPPPTTTTSAAATTSSSYSSSSPCSSAASTGASARALLLKLDYQEILAAWADRGSLYIGHAAPPRQRQDPQPTETRNVLVEVEPPPAATCAPPETVAQGRAERVRRYKEKRRNRLFDHRIRYEVRRVNAVRRPRFKGRFIKEHDEEMEIQPT